MAIVRVLLLLAAAVDSVASSRTVPLRQVPGKVSREQLATRALTRHPKARSTGMATATDDAGFWYGSFDVGDSKGVSLIIDTGSDFLVLNPGIYQPSPASIDRKATNSYVYASMDRDGCGMANISYKAYQDTVTVGGLTAHNQSLVATIPKPSSPGHYTQFAGQGLLGLTMQTGANLLDSTDAFFTSLCAQGVLDECRFGLAFGYDGTGTQVYGSLDRSRFDGELSTTATDPGWLASSKLVVNGSQVIADDGHVYFDSGTINVILPTLTALKLFAAAGMQTVQQNLPGCHPVTFAFYPCDAPPTVGFQVGDKVFNIDHSQFQLENNGNNNCTSIITGIDFPEADSKWWLVGQAWFQGKYVDFNGQNGYQMGVAMLK